jgi:hypothetical protein
MEVEVGLWTEFPVVFRISEFMGPLEHGDFGQYKVPFLPGAAAY